MVAVLAVLPLGTEAVPTAGVEFGEKFIVCYEDLRPQVVMAGLEDSTLKVYPAGIKPPTTKPGAASNGGTSGLLIGSEQAAKTIYVAYRFYSSKRVVRSQLSPIKTFTMTDPVQKIVVNGFEAPRDDALACDIDKIEVAIQLYGNAGLICVEEEMQVDCSTQNWTTASLTFNLSAETLDNRGMDCSEADQYFMVPPAVKYAARLGERVWFGGQRRHIELSNTSLTATVGQTFRPELDQDDNNILRTKLLLTGENFFDDSHLYYSVYANGKYLGEIFDIENAQVAWLDRDLDASLTETTNWYMVGHNDRIWPSSWHNSNSGGVAIPYPECINLIDRQVLEAGLDEGQTLKGLARSREFLAIVFSESVMIMSDDRRVNHPAPEFRQDFGRVGAISPRSICRDLEGAVAWVGEEGITRANTAGILSIAHDLACDKLFKGGRWIALADLPGIVMSYTRGHEGYILGGFTIDGTSNYWGLLTLKPQMGMWLFSGQEITSNILEYADSNGQGRVLVGDSEGRVKRLLDPTVLTDVPVGSDTPAAFTWSFRTGWLSKQDGEPWTLGRIKLLGVILPGATVSLTVTVWKSDYPVRDEDDLPAGQIETVSVAETALPLDIQVGGGLYRYYSVAISASSSSGADGTRKVEIPRIQLLADNEGKAND